MNSAADHNPTDLDPEGAVMSYLKTKLVFAEL